MDGLATKPSEIAVAIPRSAERANGCGGREYMRIELARPDVDAWVTGNSRSRPVSHDAYRTGADLLNPWQ
jgi:hypothetical protein